MLRAILAADGVEDVARTDTDVGQDACDGVDGVVVVGQKLLLRARPVARAEVRLGAHAIPPRGGRVLPERRDDRLDRGGDVAVPQFLVDRRGGVAVCRLGWRVAHGVRDVVQNDPRRVALVQAGLELFDQAGEVHVKRSVGPHALVPGGMLALTAAEDVHEVQRIDERGPASEPLHVGGLQYAERLVEVGHIPETVARPDRRGGDGELRVFHHE